MVKKRVERISATTPKQVKDAEEWLESDARHLIYLTFIYERHESGDQRDRIIVDFLDALHWYDVHCGGYSPGVRLMLPKSKGAASGGK